MRTLIPFVSSFLMGIGMKINQLGRGKGGAAPGPAGGKSTFFWLGF